MKNSFISVVIPFYNEQDFLPACLKALQSELLAGDELILVDNNSTDKSLESVKAYQFKLLKEPRQGQVFAQASGFAAAKHNLIVRLDADSQVMPGWRKAMLKGVSKADAFTAPGVTYDMPFGLDRTSKRAVWWGFITHRLAIGAWPLWGSNFIIKKSAWAQITSKITPSQQIWEDTEAAIHAKNLGLKVGFDWQPVIKFSGRSAKDLPIKSILAYQLRAPRTYLWQAKYLAATFVFLEMAIRVSMVMPLLIAYKLKTQPNYKPAKAPGS